MTEKRRGIAVPPGFASAYSAAKRDLALAAHWWNPLAWAALRAFHEDQEFATDAHMLAARGPDAVASYTHVLAKAAGLGALPACYLNARANLKGRLMMLTQQPVQTANAVWVPPPLPLPATPRWRPPLRHRRPAGRP